MKKDERTKDAMLALFVIGGVSVSAMLFIFGM
jgi:hypothetical protein